MLTGSQKDIYSLLAAAVKERKKLSIVKGNSGSGKTYLIEYISAQMPDFQIYRLSGDRHNQERPYYPFKNLLREVYTTHPARLNKKLRKEAVHNVVIQAGSFSPLGADSISACIAEFSENEKKKRKLYHVSFTDDEIEMLFPLDYFCGGRTPTLFLADDLQYWDESSLQLLYTLTTHPNEPTTFLKNAIAVATINQSVHHTSDYITALEECAHESAYELREIALSEYRETMETLGCSVHLSEDLLATLYSITGGNLQLMADIVLLLQDSSKAEDDICNIIERQNLGHLVIERLNKEGAEGVLVNDALMYGALFGNSFYYHDLETVLTLHESKIRSIIEEAQNHYLVKSAQMSASFVHELIREAYQREAKGKKDKYYVGFSDCMKLLHPGDYMLRAEALFAAEQYKDAWIACLLNAIKELRSHRSYQEPPLPEDIPPQFKAYFTAIKAAYHAFDEENYRGSLRALEQIEDIYPQSLLAEKNYLLSLVLSKWIDTRSRVRAKACLEPFIELQNVDGETEVWERVLSAYIVACVHNNDIALAQQYQEKLIKSLKSRLDFDLEASFRLNTLRRKASSLHRPEVAFQQTKASKDFFAPKGTVDGESTPLNAVEYYMSLNNFIAAALMVGRAADGYDSARLLIELPRKYPYLSFQRYEMPLNNAVLTAYLTSCINAGDARRTLKDVLEKCETENSTSVIIRVNLAVFTALCGDFPAAKEQLERLDQETAAIENLEFYYSYLIRVNLAAVLYMSNERDRCVELLESLLQNALLSFDEALELHACALLSSCQDGGHRDLRWYTEAMPQPKSGSLYPCDGLWDYYGRKYLLGELEFWSES